jgi:hypothetical protein
MPHVRVCNSTSFTPHCELDAAAWLVHLLLASCRHMIASISLFHCCVLIVARNAIVVLCSLPLPSSP